MTGLPYTQRTLSSEKQGWQFPKYSPDGSIFVSYDEQWPGMTIWDNATRTLSLFDTTFYDTVWGPTEEYTGIRPYAISNDGTLWGSNMGTSESVDSILVKRVGNGLGAISLVADLPILIDGTRGVTVFNMPDASEQLVIFPQQTSGDNFQMFLYNRTTNDLTVFDVSDETGENFWPLAVCQDSFGDVWVVGFPYDVVNPLDTVYFWRIIDTGLNSGVGDFQTVTGMPELPAGTIPGIRVWDGPSGFVVTWGISQFTARYLVRISGFAVADTEDWGSVSDDGSLILDFTDQGTGQHTPGGSSIYLVDYGADVSLTEATSRTVTEISLTTLQAIRVLNLDEWIDNPPDEEFYQAFDKTTPALVCAITDASGGGSISWRYWDADGGSVDGDGDGLTDESLRLRVWEYKLDGHAFAVFRVGPSESLIYDLTTGQFSNWQSPGRDNWRAHVGQNWIGMGQTTLARGFGSDVVCGDDASNVLWVLDPTTGRDDRSTTGSDYFPREVTGLITIDGREVLNCGAVTLSLSLGNPTQTGATITLETSDDLGQSWYDHGSNTITASDYSAVVEWRALGLARAPGRLFKFTDNGAATRISCADLR